MTPSMPVLSGAASNSTVKEPDWTAKVRFCQVERLGLQSPAEELAEELEDEPIEEELELELVGMLELLLKDDAEELKLLTDEADDFAELEELEDDLFLLHDLPNLSQAEPAAASRISAVFCADERASLFAR